MANDLETRQAAKELLLADHRYFGELFQRNEQIGETRVNWFIGIVTGATGGLVTLLTKSSELGYVRLRLIVMAALIALLVFGLVTLFRIIQRNRTTDGFKKDLDNVRQVFRDYFDPEYVLLDYQPLHARRKKRRRTIWSRLVKKWSNWIKNQALPSLLESFLLGKWVSELLGLRKFGGLAYTVAALNSLIIAALAAAYSYPQMVATDPAFSEKLRSVFTRALWVLLISFVFHWLLLAWQEWKAKRMLRAGAVTHAGGVVFSSEDETYLIVRPAIDKHEKRKPTEWVLPKGKVETGEHHAETALREVLEETGVRARVIRVIGMVEYKVKKQNLKVKYYLMEKVFQGKPLEPRDSEWMPYDKAIDELTHDESKEIVELAEKARARS